MYNYRRVKKQCPTCGKKYWAKRSQIYCNDLCSLDADSIRRSASFRLIIELLVERGEKGMRDDTSFYLDRLFTMNWLTRDSDRYYRLSQWGYTAAENYYPDLFEVAA